MRVLDAKGLMAFWTDIEDEHLLDVQKWHNCEEESSFLEFVMYAPKE